ncbi:hypothetical protein [Terrihabitans sp. B22-R8]|uniref:hypothetical protein n=1 Tax=Terrihabitans sp. B22-R8 TaxID=3425128 RepID=UPI00403C54C7
MSDLEVAVAAYRYDVEADVKWANTRMAQLFRVDPVKAADGTPAKEYAKQFINPLDFDRIMTRVRDAAVKCENYVETYCLDVNGEERTLFSSGCGLVDASGRKMLVGTIIDVTPGQAMGFLRGRKDLDRIADACIDLHKMADRADMKVLKHLMNMALLELAPSVAKAEKLKRLDMG